jgi:hypothetical protein
MFRSNKYHEYSIVFFDAQIMSKEDRLVMPIPFVGRFS